MKLSRLNLVSDLPEWKPSDTSGFTQQAKRLRKLAATAGSDGDTFNRHANDCRRVTRSERLQAF